MRLLPLALTVIWASTALSVEVRPPEPGPLIWKLGLGDFLLNIFLYVPLGVALHKHGCGKAGLAGAGLSILIESIQVLYPDRFTALTDVIGNTLGAVIGCLVYAPFGRRNDWSLNSIELTRALGVFSLMVCLLFIVLVSFPRKPSDFRNWDPECRLLLGDELTGDRPWNGVISKSMIFPTCLDAETVSRLSKQDVGVSSTSGKLGKEALYTFQNTDGFDAIQGEPLLSDAERETFFETFVGSGTLTLLVWFRSDDVSQGGPARIISYSKSPWRQNFMLGQEGRNLVLRVLTPTTAPGGFTPQLESWDVLDEGRETYVAATYDGRNSRVYVDGRQIQRLNLRARGRLSPFLADSGLPAAATLAGVMSGLGFLGISAGTSRRRWLVGGLGGVTAGVVFLLVGGADALTEFALWIPILSLWGGAMSAGAIRRGPTGGDGR